MMKRALITMLPLIVLLLPAGCALGPDYQQPERSNDAGWQSEQDGRTAAEGRETLWWQQLGDPLLDELVSESASHNRELAAAIANIEQSRAMRRAAFGGYFPSVDASAAANRNRYSNQNAFRTNSGIRNNYTAGLDASWELDLLGRTKRSVEAADARLQAGEATRDGVQLTVLAESATAYFELRGLQKQRANIARNIEILTEVETIARAQFEAGATSRLDLTRAVGEREALAAQLPDLDARITARIYRISVLAGHAPEFYRERLQGAAAIDLPSDPVPVGLRSDILRKRPDVRIAERELAAATADIGVAKADLFPSFSLTGAIGSSARLFSDLFTGNTMTGAIGAALNWPLFRAGALTAQVDAAEAGQRAALANYEQAVLLALEDAENALMSYGKAWQRLKQLQVADAANRRAFEIAKLRYEAGEESFMVVLDAERTRLATENNIIDAETIVLTDLARLYKSLGGSWLTAVNTQAETK